MLLKWPPHIPSYQSSDPGWKREFLSDAPAEVSGETLIGSARVIWPSLTQSQRPREMGYSDWPGPDHMPRHSLTCTGKTERGQSLLGRKIKQMSYPASASRGKWKGHFSQPPTLSTPSKRCHLCASSRPCLPQSFSHNSPFSRIPSLTSRTFTTLIYHFMQ